MRRALPLLLLAAALHADEIVLLGGGRISGEVVAEDAREVTVRADDKEFQARVRIDTPKEVEYYQHGGILPFVLRQLLAG